MGDPGNSRLFTTHEVELGVTFVLSPTAMLLVGGTLQFERGDQSKPYRYIPTFDPIAVQPFVPNGATIDLVNKYRTPLRPLEQLPTERDRYAFGFRLNKRIGNSTLRLEERLYFDTWLQKATTTDIRYMVDLTRRLRLWPHVRIHAQTAANFYQLAYGALAAGSDLTTLFTYRSSDRELSPMVSATLGGGVRIALGSLEGDVRYGLSFVRVCPPTWPTRRACWASGICWHMRRSAGRPCAARFAPIPCAAFRRPAPAPPRCWRCWACGGRCRGRRRRALRDAFAHRFAELGRVGYADRASCGGRSGVPAGAGGGFAGCKAYLVRRAALVGARAGPLPRPAGLDCAAPGEEGERPSTTHLSIVDAAGNAVALTSSIEDVFGNRRMAGGFPLNNQLTDFSTDGANRLVPGKRPRSAMAPTLVFDRRGRVFAVLSSSSSVMVISPVSFSLFRMARIATEPRLHRSMIRS